MNESRNISKELQQVRLPAAVKPGLVTGHGAVSSPNSNVERGMGDGGNYGDSELTALQRLLVHR